jgi:hypothetical protein
MTQLSPFFRDATFTLVPTLTDDQLDRIGESLAALHPSVPIRRLTERTALVQGIPIRALTPHEADASTWERLNDLIRGALSDAGDDATRITSIDVRNTNGALS